MEVEDSNGLPDSRMERFIAFVESGHIPLDGVMSPLTRELVEIFGAEGKD